MPTAARLFSAVAFAMMAFFASEVFKPLLPEGTQMGMLSQVNAFIGLISGWLVMGRLAGNGYYAAIGSSVRTTFVILFYVLVLWSLSEMLERSTGMHYGGPVEALKGMMDLIAEYSMMVVQGPEVVVVLLAGGLLAGFLAEWASERWS